MRFVLFALCVVACGGESGRTLSAPTEPLAIDGGDAGAGGDIVADGTGGSVELADVPIGVWVSHPGCANYQTDGGAYLYGMCAVIEPGMPCVCAPTCDDAESSSSDVTADRAEWCESFGGHCAYGYHATHPVCVP